MADFSEGRSADVRRRLRRHTLEQPAQVRRRRKPRPIRAAGPARLSKAEACRHHAARQKHRPELLPTTPAGLSTGPWRGLLTGNTSTGERVTAAHRYKASGSGVRGHLQYSVDHEDGGVRGRDVSANYGDARAGAIGDSDGVSGGLDLQNPAGTYCRSRGPRMTRYVQLKIQDDEQAEALPRDLADYPDADLLTPEQENRVHATHDLTIQHACASLQAVRPAQDLSSTGSTP